MAASHRDGADGLGTQLIGDLPEVRCIMQAQVARLSDGIKHFSSSLLG
jgi:hypothetical protein